jgi:glycosyltransferase involved in cell wall biosynthesis
MRPRLLVDARMLTSSGIGRHIQFQLGSLTEHASLVAAVSRRDDALEIYERYQDVAPLMLRAPIYSLREQLLGSLLSVRFGRKLAGAWYPHYNAPWFSARPAIVTVHDLLHVTLPDVFGRGLKARFAELVLRRAVERAELVGCVSRATAADLERVVPSVAEKIRITPNGLSEYWTPVSDNERESFRQRRLRKQGVHEYLLAVGNKKPHKNFGLLLDLIEKLSSDYPALRLIVIGRGEDLWRRQLEDWRRSLGRGSLVVNLDDVSDHQLRLYYSCAKALLFPSIKEGFGFPPLEAMACGTAVIASDIEVTREVLEDAALLVEPRDLNGWEEATRAVLARKEGERDCWREAGFRQAAKYRKPPLLIRDLFAEIGVLNGHSPCS